jgi:hypothetical protein
MSQMTSPQLLQILSGQGGSPQGLGPASLGENLLPQGATGSDFMNVLMQSQGLGEGQVQQQAFTSKMGAQPQLDSALLMAQDAQAPITSQQSAAELPKQLQQMMNSGQKKLESPLMELMKKKNPIFTGHKQEQALEAKLPQQMVTPSNDQQQLKQLLQTAQEQKVLTPNEQLFKSGEGKPSLHQALKLQKSMNGKVAQQVKLPQANLETSPIHKLHPARKSKDVQLATDFLTGNNEFTEAQPSAGVTAPILALKNDKGSMEGFQQKPLIDMNDPQLMGAKNTSELIDKISGYISEAQLQSKESLDVNIRHDDLGVVGLKVNKADGDQVALHFQTSTEDARSFFVNHQDRLISKLQTAGLQVSDFKVDFKQSSFESAMSQDGSSHHERHSQQHHFESFHQGRGNQDSQRRRHIWNMYQQYKEAA